MADELEVLETPGTEVDEAVQQDPQGDGEQTEVQDKPEEPFLPVNDRTIYKTREDAVRGYNEAANRIQQLSQWEKEAKQWGLGDPSQLRNVANELLQLRREKAEAAAQAGKRNVEPRVDPADPKAKEAAQVREYMKSLGYVSKEEQEEALKELREFVNEYRQNDSRSTELRFETQEADARDDVAGYLATDGFKDDGTGMKLSIVGTLIKDWINGSEERIELWSRGGRTAQNLVKEGYDFSMRALEWKKAPATTGGVLKPTDPGYAEAKARAVAQNKKGLPAQGTAKERGQDGRFSKTTPKQKGGHINAELHQKAWDLINSGGAE
jgi:hypothetical protein